MDIITIGLLIFSIILLIILSWVWPPDSPWSPWWRTNVRKSEIATRLAKINSKDVIYELGCGEATFLTTAVKKSEASGVGVEIDPVRYLTAWLNIRLHKLTGKIELKKSNFFDVNLNPANVVFVYLVPRVLEKLKPKLYKELKKGTKIISYKYKFEIKKKEKLRKILEDKENELYIYKII